MIRSIGRRAIAVGALLAIALAGCGIPGSRPAPSGRGAAQARAEGGFFWGVSTAGYQYEGDETTSQWAQWDLAGKTEERRGHADDGYHRYAQDMDLARGMGCNAWRTSLEWARIEPVEGQFNQDALDHYRFMLEAAHAKGLTPIVTLMHFSYPAWLDQYGGWTNPKAVDDYLRFVDKVTHEFGDQIGWYLTFNEPTVFIGGSYLSGIFPPGHQGDLWGAAKVTKNLITAHIKAYDLIHRNQPSAHVSFNHYVASWTVGLGRSTQATDDDAFVNGVLHPQPGGDTPADHGDEPSPSPIKLDYFAFDYYTRLKATIPFSVPADWDWTVYPEGMYGALKKWHGITGLPVLVAENGMCTEDLQPRSDGWSRDAYLAAHVEQLEKARHEGVPVLGYMHWSITDNYEWGSYRPRFGLFSVGCRSNDQTRVPTPAVDVYRKIIASDGVTPAITRMVHYPEGYQPLVSP
jgi:beta-glucosidase